MQPNIHLSIILAYIAHKTLYAIRGHFKDHF
jgi:hypothetical protein